MAYTIEWLETGLLARFSGKISIETIFSCDNEIYSDARFSEIEYGIYDFLDADLSALVQEDVVKLSSVDTQRSWTKKHFKVAVVAQNHITRMLSESYKYFSELRGSGWVTEVFDNLEIARTWCEGKDQG